MFCQSPRGPRWLTEALRRLTQRPRRVNVTDGSLTETDGSLTDTHGSGGQWSRRRWAAVRWILGLCWGWCPGMPLCRCDGVHVCRCAGDRGGVPIYRRATFPLSYVLAIIILWFLSAPLMFVLGFLQVSQMVLLWFPMDFLQVPIVCLWFPMFSFQSGCSYGFPVNFLRSSYDSRWFS